MNTVDLKPWSLLRVQHDVVRLIIACKTCAKMAMLLDGLMESSRSFPQDGAVLSSAASNCMVHGRACRLYSSHLPIGIAI
jgi:hypothetical protein